MVAQPLFDITRFSANCRQFPVNDRSPRKPRPIRKLIRSLITDKVDY
jgi:hypothetical protein